MPAHADLQNRIRVLHCIHSLSGGGAERQIKLLADASRSEGMETAVFCVNDAGNDIKDPEIRIFKSRKSNKFNFSIFGSLNDAVADFKPHIIHAWMPGSVTIPAMLMALLRGIPCVYSYRTRMRFHRLMTFVEYVCVLVVADRIVSNNPVIQSVPMFRWLFSKKQGVEIKNCVYVDPRFYKQAAVAGRRQTIKILFVGRFIAVKNLECLLRAVALLGTEQNWELILCGDGDERGTLQKLIGTLGLADRVTLLGYRQDVYSIMQQSDVLVMPSWYEGMPNVLLEGLTIGIPCIASDIVAHRNVVGDSGAVLMFDPRCPEQLAACIREIEEKPSLAAELRVAGLRLVEEYSPENMAKQYHDIYQDMRHAIYAGVDSGAQ